MEKYKNICDLVNIKSFDENQNNEIITCLEKKFSSGKQIIKIKNDSDNKYNMIVGINTNLQNIENAIILSGHIDTVPADEKNYATNPYQATKINNKIFGLGIIDMKCFFASIIDNLEFLKSCKLPIVVCISSDEETKLNGINKITNTLRKNNIKPYFTLVGEPTSLEFCTKSKSCFEYSVQIYGKSCHSSKPQNGINSNYICAKMINFIEKLAKKYKNTSLSCNIMQGGEKVNIISSYAKINFDIRSTQKKYAEKCIKKITKKSKQLEKKYAGAKIEITNNLYIPALENQSKKLVDKILKKYNKTPIEFIGGCEAGYFCELGGEAIIFGAGDLSLAHKPNEFLDVENYEKYNQMFVQIINEICQKSI